jgi:hypothetical protein
MRSRTSFFRDTVTVSCLLLSVAAAGPAAALPLYASREGAKCVGCHFDPNGGGIRNDHGFSYAKNRHSMEPEDRWADVTVDPQLNDWIRLGLDTRMTYIASHTQGDESTLSTSTFFPMQANLRVAVTPVDHLSIVGSHGLYLDTSPGATAPYLAREWYGLFHGLPHDAFVQVGRFRNPFGLRQDDHTSFVRSIQFLSYNSQVEDAGIAVGATGRNGWFEFSFTNGEGPLEERAQALAGKVAWSYSWLQGGVSGYHRYDESDDVSFDRWSLYLTRTFGPLTLLGEYGRGTTEDDDIAVNNDAAFAEAVYRLNRGVDFRGKFDWMDSDRDEGGSITKRYMGRVDLTPMPFVQLQLSASLYEYELAPEVAEYVGMLFLPF